MIFHKRVIIMMFLVIITLVTAGYSFAQSNQERPGLVSFDFSNKKAIGKLEPFYRGTQLQGNGLKVKKGLVKVPHSLMEMGRGRS